MIGKEKKRKVKIVPVLTGMLLLLMVLVSLSVLSLSVISTVEAQELFEDPTLKNLETPHDEYDALQLPAEEGKPVQWVKQVNVENLYDQAETEVLVTVPKEAKNVTVTDENRRKITAEKQELDVKIRDRIGFNQKKTYIVKYETEPPEKQEGPLRKEGKRYVKDVVVKSEYHYKDILTTAELPSISKKDKDKVRLYWKIDGLRKDVTNDPEFNLKLIDLDADGKYDRMAWITPHLSTQIFEVVILSDVDPGNYTDIGLELLAPADGEYITSTSSIGFNYSVSYNSSTTVKCNLTVDGEVKRENIETTADKEITTYFNLSSGQHNWNVACSGDDGTKNTSETRQFTIDLDNPQVQLETPDYHVSHTDTIRLNFTVVDEKYPAFDCYLSVNGKLNQSNIIAMNNSQKSILLSGLHNGVYDWNVSCKDAAGNLGKSEERVFYISQGTPNEYNISSNQKSYGIGETGYLIIDAPAGSNLTMFVSKPNHDSFFKWFNGQNFPIVDLINYTSNSGTYDIDGIFNTGGDMYVVKTSFDVTNTFYVDLDTNETTGQPGQEFTFEANASGGIGSVTYEWDFDDGTTSTNGSEVTHKFDDTGDYYVEVTATDGKGNKVSEREHIRVYEKHNLLVTVKELQTEKLLEDIKVEADDQRKDTGPDGEANFSLYEGKIRVYIAEEGYEWYKKVFNITEDTELTVELNNTAITNYTPKSSDTEDETSGEMSEEEEEAKNKAELMLAKVEAALEGLENKDQAEKSVTEALDIKAELQKAKKKLRQAIRDLGKTEIDEDMDQQTRSERAKNITDSLEDLDGTILELEVEETTEFVDYPKSTTISMLSTEYLKYKGLDYSEKQKEKYSESNIELQKEVAIESRLSVVEVQTLGGNADKIAVVTNKVTKKPEDLTGIVIIEYIPKEVAENAADIESKGEFEVVKGDPILKFDAGLEEYSYSVVQETTLEKLKNTKHVMLYDPEEKKDEGLSKVTGLSILPNLEFENPTLVVEIVVITLLLLAYLAYHFEVPDKIREWRKKNGKGSGKYDNKYDYESDTAYKPESRFETFTRKAKTFVKKEEEAVSEEVKKEIQHLKALISLGHVHAEKKRHEKARQTYTHVKDTYKELSKEAKGHVHKDTKELFHKINLTKAEHLIEKAFAYLEAGDHKTAKRHYSEIKKIYNQLEKRHRAAISERCIQLHQKLFENSLS